MSDERVRNDAGQFVAQRDPETLAESMTPGEPYTTTELAEAVGWPRRSAYDALATLHDAERVNKKQVNARTIIWTRPAEGPA